jgi:hypothetical protein
MTNLMPLAAETTYRCPGELDDISRAIHLGRLSAYYEGCRHCPHRDDVEGLSAGLRQRLAEAHLAPVAPLLEPEAVAGLYGDQLDAALVRRYAAAFGIWLRQRTGRQEPATVLLASDDRPLAADLVAAASDGLRFVGCNVVDLGGRTAASLANQIARDGAAGGVLVGNILSELRTASVSLWGGGGQPISTHPGENALEQIWELAARPVPRPGRRYGGWRRGAGGDATLDRLTPYFHALRPLCFRLDTSCLPLKRVLSALLGQVACRMVVPGQVDQRAAERFHFYVWIDGNGERLKLWNEQRQEVDSERLLCLLAAHCQQPAAAVVVEQDIAAATVERLRATSCQIHRAHGSRAAMHAAMLSSGASLGGGPSGRFWFSGPSPAADALAALAQLLVILSQSDRPLSEVLSRPAQVE